MAVSFENQSVVKHTFCLIITEATWNKLQLLRHKFTKPPPQQVEVRQEHLHFTSTLQIQVTRVITSVRRPTGMEVERKLKL